MSMPTVIFSQQNVITHLWSEGNGVFSGTFGTPTAVDASDNLYRAGFEKQSFGGTDVKLQKINGEGTLEWSVTLNSPGQDLFEPTKIYSEGSNIYVTGIVTSPATGETDFFVSQVDALGNVDWFEIDETEGRDVTSDIIFDPTSSMLFICGTTERNGTFDLLLASYTTDGNQDWLVTRDYNGNTDLGAKINLDGGHLYINGSSQSSPVQWDIVTWQYQDDGTYMNEQRNSGMNAASDELKDGAMSNGYISLVGKSDQGSHTDFKVVCLDANNNFLWQDTYNINNQDDEGTAVLASANSLTVTGYGTSSLNKEDIIVRKYDISGGLLWSVELDFMGENDRGIDIIEDAEGNYLVLADVSDGVQTDVYLYCLSGSNGSLMWSERVSDDAGLDESAVSLEAAFGGEVYVTYEVNNLSVTEAYSYEGLNFPVDGEPFSRNSFIIANSGQLKDENGKSAMDIRYYTFGMHPEMYFADDAYSLQVANQATDQLQRIDFNFVNHNATHVGQVTEYQKETHFNYYKNNNLKYEMQGTYDVLAYPAIYERVNAFVSSNSAGFKLTFVLEQGADLSTIELDIDGVSSFRLNGGSLELETVNGELAWMEPFSYSQGVPEVVDDNCVEYEIVDGNLKFTSRCGELSYPYVIQIKMGQGQAFATSTIENMDWSTFFGGDNSDGAFSIDVDSDGSIYIGGFTASTQLNVKGANLTTGGINVSNLNPTYFEQGMVLKFNSAMVLKWATILPDASLVKGVKAFDNMNSVPGQAPEEIHIVGELRSSFTAFNTISTLVAPLVTSPFLKSYQFDNFTTTNDPLINLQEGFYATLLNNQGNVQIMTSFGGESSAGGIEHIHGLDVIDIGGDKFLYFVGSTDNGAHPNQVSSSSAPPFPLDRKFPIFDPGDDSYFYAFNNTGNPLGFVAAINLKTYKLAYSSIQPDFTVIYDIDLATDAAYCGKSASSAKAGRWKPASTRFAKTSSQLDFTNLDYFSAVCPTSDGHMFFGLNETKTNSLLTTSLASTQYQNGSGQSYMVRLSNLNNTPVWDSYFGDIQSVTSNQTGWWGSLNSLVESAPGNLAYNSAIKTVFSGASAAQNPVETKDKTGYFYEDVIASTTSTNPDMYVAAFVENVFTRDYFNWGTIYGGLDIELMTDMVSYERNGAQYLITTGISFSEVGTTASNDNDYPVSNIGGLSHFQQNNSTPLSSGFSDVVITRFEISDVNISISENNQYQSNIYIYPNPTNSTVQVEMVSLDQSIENLRVYDNNGKCIIKMELTPDQVLDRKIQVDLSSLAKGIYILSVNNIENVKIIKL